MIEVAEGDEPAEPGSDILSELPHVLATVIARQLSLRQRSLCACVSSGWHRLFSSPAVWEKLIVSEEHLQAERGLQRRSHGASRECSGTGRELELLPFFVQLRMACRGQVKILNVRRLSLAGRERAFLEFVHSNSFLRELSIHECGLRVGEAR